MPLSRGWLLAAALTILAVPTVGTAQGPRRPVPPLQAASRALLEGRYSEMDALTDKLDPKDPNVAAVRARALIARGKYGDAEALLRPVVSRGPNSEAALQLGLLMQLLSRDARESLRRVTAEELHQ